MSSVMASITSLGRQFQSLIVPGKNEAFLYCVLAVMTLKACHDLGTDGGWGGVLGGWDKGLGHCGSCAA